MSGNTGSFVRDALHQIPVGRDHIRVVINNREAVAVECCTQKLFGECHSHRVGQSLPERPSGRFDSLGKEVLRMTGRSASELTKSLEFVEWKLLISPQMQ